MLTRVALFAGGLAAAFTLAAAMAVGGLVTARPSSAGQPAAASAATPTPTPVVQFDTVYVPAPVPQQTVVVHRAAAVTGGEHESGSEGGDD